MNSPRRECAPEEIVSCKQTSRVLGIHKRQVKENTLDDEEDADRGDYNADARHDPVNIRVRRPPEDEQAHGNEKGDEERRDETAFRGSETMETNTGFDAVANVPPIPHYAEDDTDSDGEEGETEFAEIEGIHLVVDEGKGFKEGVEDAVHDGGVDGCESDTGIEEHELKGAPESFDSDGAGCEVCLVDFRLAFQLRVAGEEAEALGAAEENGGVGCFWEEEEEGKEDGAVEPEHLP